MVTYVAYIGAALVALAVVLIMGAEYVSQTTATRLQLKRHSSQLDKEIADFNKYSMLVAIVCLPIALASVTYRFTQQFGLWIPLVLLLPTACFAAWFVPKRIVAIKAMRHRLRELSVPTLPPDRQITQHIVIDPEEQ